MPEFKVGHEMAERVAKRLKMKCDLMYSHRDYCGTGLQWDKGKFYYGKVYDGFQMHPIKTFEREQEFINWLAEQTDNSLAGLDEGEFERNNQRLTLNRLFEFVNSKPNPRMEG